MNRITENILFVGGGLIIGFVVGGVITNERLKKVYAERAEEDIRSVKKHYMVLYKGGEYSTPEKAIKSYRKRVADLGYVSKASETVEGQNEKPEEEKTTEEQIEEWNSGLEVEDEPNETEEEYSDSPVADALEAERQRHIIAQRLEDEKPGGYRDPARPYVISVDEFMEEDPPYGKPSITYFKEDDVLMDEREDVISDIIGTIGEECLTQFGHLSQDPNSVYVRNDRLMCDYEVTMDERAYSEVVVGIRRPKKRPPKYKETD